MKFCTKPAFALSEQFSKGMPSVIKDSENIITPSAGHNEITACSLWIVLCLFRIARQINISNLPAGLIRLKCAFLWVSDKNIGRKFQNMPYDVLCLCTVKYNADVINLDG